MEFHFLVQFAGLFIKFFDTRIVIEWSPEFSCENAHKGTDLSLQPGVVQTANSIRSKKYEIS